MTSSTYAPLPLVQDPQSSPSFTDRARIHPLAAPTQNDNDEMAAGGSTAGREDSGRTRSAGVGGRGRFVERSQSELDRHDRVRALLDEAASCTDPVRRQWLQSRVVLEHRSVAKAIAARYRGRGVERGDLEQLAYLGLVKAARRWEPGRSEDFLQFAVPTIAGEVRRYFRDQLPMIRPPRRIQELRAVMAAPDAGVADRALAERSDAEISTELGVEVGAVREARQASTLYRPYSLDAPSTTGQTLSQTWGQDDRRLVDVEERLTVAALLDQLTERERDLVRMRFVQGLSQSRIGEEIGVSQMQVSRLLRGISAKLRPLIDPDPAADPAAGRTPPN